MSLIRFIRIAGTTGLRTMLCLLFIAGSLTASATTKGKKKSGQVQQTMTVARVIPGDPLDSFTEVTFSESQRFFRISDKSHKYLKVLKAAEKSGKPVIVTRANEKSDIILKVENAKQAPNP